MQLQILVLLRNDNSFIKSSWYFIKSSCYLTALAFFFFPFFSPLFFFPLFFLLCFPEAHTVANLCLQRLVCCNKWELGTAIEDLPGRVRAVEFTLFSIFFCVPAVPSHLRNSLSCHYMLLAGVLR